MIRTAGVVLCGGHSTRMGRPKAWLPFGDELMLPRVVRLLSEAVSPVVVVAAPGQDVPPLPAGVEIAHDAEPDRGPLAGLCAGLSALRGRADAAYLSSCDVPFLRPAFIRRLIDLLGEHAICVPESGGFRHPLAAVYRIEVAAVAERLLAEGDAGPTFLFDKLPTRVVTAQEFADADAALESLRNVNTPGEYEAALLQARS